MAGSGWRLAGIWPWWVLLAAEAAALLLAVAAYHASYRWLSPSRRWLLLFLRWFWVQAVVLAALRPVVESVMKVRDVPSLILMVDTSASMARRDEMGKGRLEAAKEAVEAVWPELRAGAGRFLPMLAAFDREVRQLAGPEEIPEATGDDSRLELALRWAITRAGLPSLGLVLFSDGAASSYLEALAEAERLRSMRLPVYPVLLGAAPTGPETWIEQVEGPEDIPVRQAEQMTVKVVYSLPAPAEMGTTLTVTEDGRRQVSRGEVLFYGTGGSLEVPVPYKPLVPGYHWLEFRLEPVAGERRPDNNYALRLVRAVAQGLAVTALSRGFSFDVGLLCRRLRQRAGVAAEICALPAGRPRFETAEELSSTSDVVLLEAPALSALEGGYLRAIAGFLRAGGGLVLLAGPDWRPQEKEAREAWGILFGRVPEVRRETSSTGWLLRPSSRYWRALALSPRPAENRTLWTRLGPLSYRYLLDGSFLEDARVLVSFSDGRPFILAGGYGRGRVALVLGGPLYPWALGSGRLFGRFAERLVRAVYAGRRQRRALRVEPERLLYRAGEEVRVRVEGEGEEAELALSVRGAAEPLRRLEVRLERGRALVSLGGDLPGGPYAVVVRAGGEKAEAGFVVEQALDEAARLEPEHGLLDHLASLTRGRSVRGGAAAVKLVRELASQPPPPVRYVRREIPLVPFYVYLAAFLFAATAEWYLRRRWGLV